MRTGFRWIWASILGLSAVIPARADVFGTFNLRHENKGDEEKGNGWKRRLPVVAAMIRFHEFDVVGTQEGFEGQMEDLKKELPDHDIVSFGRDDGEKAGEQMGIIYRREKFELLRSGRFWLSETPDEPGRGWDASLPRLCAWAELKDRENGRKIWFFSTHLDHRGNEARKESAELILRRMKELAGDEVMILAGDLNSGDDSEPYRVFEDSPLIEDAFQRARIRLATTGTANKFDAESFTTSRIDHVFVKEGIKVVRYGILTDSYRVTDDEAETRADGNFPKEVEFQEAEARLPSDHFPVLIEVEWD